MGCSSSKAKPAGAGPKLVDSGNQGEQAGTSNSKNLRIKLVLLGDSAVGKSCLVLRFVRGQFDPSSKVSRNPSGKHLGPDSILCQILLLC